MMIGVGSVPRSFMLEIRANGKCRKTEKCFKQPRQVVAPRVTVRRLLEWLSNNVARRWMPYHILHQNCQHMAEELQQYVRDPNGTSAYSPTVLEDPEHISTRPLCVEAPSSPGPNHRKASAPRGHMALRSSSFGASGAMQR